MRFEKFLRILQNTNFDLGAFSKKPFYKKRTLGKISVIISLKKVRFFINIGGKVLRYYFAYYFFFFYILLFLQIIIKNAPFLIVY